MDHFHNLALGRLLGTTVSDPKQITGLAASALRTQIVNQLKAAVRVSLLRRCRTDPSVVVFAAPLGLTEVCAQYELHRMESKVGGCRQTLRRSTFDHMPLGAAGLPTDALLIPLRDHTEPGERTQDNDIDRYIHCTECVLHVGRGHAAGEY